MGNLLKESLFSLLCPQKVLLPPKPFPEQIGALPSASSVEDVKGVTLISWCHFWHCFTTNSLLGTAPSSPYLYCSFHPLGRQLLYPCKHTATFLQVFSTWLSFPLHTHPPASISTTCLLPGPYTSSIFSALPTVFSRLLTYQVVSAKL